MLSSDSSSCFDPNVLINDPLGTASRAVGKEYSANSLDIMNKLFNKAGTALGGVISGKGLVNEAASLATAGTITDVSKYFGAAGFAIGIITELLFPPPSLQDELKMMWNAMV